MLRSGLLLIAYFSLFSLVTVFVLYGILVEICVDLKSWYYIGYTSSVTSQVMLYSNALFYAMLNYLVLQYIMLSYTMPNQISFYQTVFHIKLNHIISYHIMLCLTSSYQLHKHTHTHTLPLPPSHTLYLESVPHAGSEVRILANHDPTH